MDANLEEKKNGFLVTEIQNWTKCNLKDNETTQINNGKH